MRVLLVGPYPPPHGGVQTHLVAIRRFLQTRAVPVAVINITRHRKGEGDGVYYPADASQLVRLLTTLDYDVIHLHFGGNLTNRLLALSLTCSLVPGIRTVLTFHSGGYPSSPQGRAARFWSWRGFVLRRFDRVVAVNSELADMFARFGVPRSRISVMNPHAQADTGTAASMPEGLRAFLDRHTPKLVAVGGLEPEYAVPLQVDMLGLLLERFPSAGLAVIGSGSQEAEIRQYVQSKPWASQVLICGDVAHESTLAAMARCDLMLRPTLYDGDSIAVREALHLGTPVLARDNGMRPAGVNLISNPTPETLSQRVEECLAQPRPVPNGSPGANADNLEGLLRLYSELQAS